MKREKIGRIYFYSVFLVLILTMYAALALSHEIVEIRGASVAEVNPEDFDYTTRHRKEEPLQKRPDIPIDDLAKMLVEANQRIEELEGALENAEDLIEELESRLENRLSRDSAVERNSAPRVINIYLRGYRPSIYPFKRHIGHLGKRQSGAHKMRHLSRSQVFRR